MDLAFVQPVAVLVYQEMSLGSRAKALGPGVSRNRPGPYKSRMQRYQTGLSKLGPSNRENAFGPIHIPGSEVQRFTEPQARDSQQTETGSGRSRAAEGQWKAEFLAAFSSFRIS